ncbi:MAG: DUF1003 domain-containing protein [Acidobacteriota bacterium]|nr:DUF1003 domain-containing protein [Acidobacteriota bacterium]
MPEPDYSAVRKNIETIVKLEERSLQERSLSDRLADSIGTFCGSMSFIVLHMAIFGFWITVNAGLIPGIPQFDKFPFLLLSVAVSIEAIFLSAFVLMKQNRMSRRADIRANLDLQINLLTEKEITLVLQMLHVMGKQLGIEEHSQPQELHELSTETAVEDLATQLQAELPE